ncbi:MAG: hypothetical protein ACI8QZ_003217 [Chlamydiales bacterium]|jgi:hypothetical protein
MVLATFGWAVWWMTAALMRFAPDWTPSFTVVSWTASTFAVMGLLMAIITIRGQRNWALLALVPLFANGALLALPGLLRDLDFADLAGPEVTADPESGSGEFDPN